MAEPKRVVIVGAGGGGDAAAIGLRKEGFEGKIVLIGADSRRPYERPYLSKQLLRGELPVERTFLRAEGEYEKSKVEMLLGQPVISASMGDREVVLENGRRIGFDLLVLATGSTPRWPPDVPRAANVMALRTLDDALHLKEAIEQADRILLIGAGFIGAEVAASARMVGKNVLMVEMAATPLERALGREVGEIYADLHRQRGVDLRTGTSVVKWSVTDDRVHSVELSDGTTQSVDLAVVGVGVAPNLDLAEDLGLETGSGGILVDEKLEAAPGVYAVGDIAAHLHPVYGRPLRVEHWQVAQRQGSAVAASIAGGPSPYRELPWFWSDQYDVNLQYVGNAIGFDEIVWHGDRQSEKFSVFYLKDGVIDAVLSVNDGRTGRFSRPLIRERIAVEPGILSDMDSDLREYARTKVPG